MSDLPPSASAIPPGQPAPDHGLQVQQLFVRHQDVVLAYVLSLEPSLADAQDIVQEVFLTISRKADTFTVGTNFPAWACTVARYQTLSFQRRRARQACTLDEDVVSLLEDGRAIDGPRFDDEVTVLKGCLLKLAPRARELIWARYHRQRMPEDIAEEIGWTANAVRVALSRARTLLRDCLTSRIADGLAKETL
jgi:RNA polymerase sigma-70 factor, ECF subfamily